MSHAARKPLSVSLLISLPAVIVCLWAVEPVTAATMAYAGTVVQVDRNDDPSDDALCRFTVRTEYLDYVSRGHFGRDTKVGETASEPVRAAGNVCMLNGQLTDAPVFAKALRPGMWGYVYESTWQDLYTLPDYQWGEVVAHDADAERFTLRIHRTHKQHHIDANPPENVTVSYDAETAFLLEGRKAEASDALAAGNWVQVHPPRRQWVSVWTEEAQYDPDRLPPYYEGRRGDANSLTAPAVLRGFRAEAGTGHGGVLDVGATLEVTRFRMGRREDITLRCGKASFILDGKVAPPHIALRRGRYVVLGHYRGEQSPHKVFVRSEDQAARGRIVSVDGNKLTVELTDRLTGEGTGREQTVELRDDAVVELNGRESSADESLRSGRRVTIRPARGRTIKAFEPGGDAPAFGPGDSLQGRVAGERHPLLLDDRMIRFDLSLGHSLQGPTSVAHRKLFVSATTDREGRVRKMDIVNFAGHSGGPAWVADLTRHNLSYSEGRLTGGFTLDVESRSPVYGGRYDFEVDAEVRANHVAGTVEISLDGEHQVTQRFGGTAVSLPWETPGYLDAVYHLTLDDPQQRIRPVDLYLEARNGEFIGGAASASGVVLQPVDVSALEMEGPRIQGKVVVALEPVHGFPQQPVTAEFELDVEAYAGRHVGSFEGVWGRD
ncbi:MAG: hypothetical protein ACP5HU_12035 [Phycisphaerae bacterium]